MALAAIFQIGSLGDTIVSLPAVRSLRELLPDCSDYILITQSETRSNVAPNQIFDMVWKAKHQLRYAVPKNGVSLRSIASVGSLGLLLAKLHYYRPKYCVYLMPADRTERQVERDRLFFRASPIRNLIGFRAITDSERTASPGLSVRTTEAYLRFRRLWNDRSEEKFAQFGVTPLLSPGSSARANVAGWLQIQSLSRAKPLVALCPYSNYPSRNIPHETLIHVLKGLDTALGADVVILGGQKDDPEAARLIADAGNGFNACGRFSPQESAALLAECALAVCTESGPMHLAGALGTPTVVTFSRINKVLHSWFPLGKNHTILYQDVPCAGCRQIVCPIATHPCMTRTAADEILAAAAVRLGRPVLHFASPEGTHSISWPEDAWKAEPEAARTSHDEISHAAR